MTIFIKWGWVLLLALIVPVSLPAGGCENKNKPLIYRNQVSNRLVSLKHSFLRTDPFANSSVLADVHIGTPLRILRSWKSEDGNDWLHVEITSGEIGNLSRSVRRGWLIA